MSAQPPTNPEVTAAIMKVVVIEGVLFAVGAALFFAFDTILGLIGAAVLGPFIALFLLWQTGAFEGRDERR